MTPQPNMAKTTPVEPRCASYARGIALAGVDAPSWHCELPAGHRGAHRCGITSWTPVDPAPAAPVPDGHPPADGDADSERIRPAATLADLDRLMANVFERWRLIQDLANSDPWVRGPGGLLKCKECMVLYPARHLDGCLWVRANRLVDQTETR